MQKWARVKYLPNLPLKENGRVTACKEHIQLSKEAAKEGAVLLKNENHLLPLKEGTKVALFGKGVFDFVKGGGGSGDVVAPYSYNLYTGLKMQETAVSVYEPLAEFYREKVAEQYKKGTLPGMVIEPELPKQLADEAGAFAEVAFIVISRFSAEGWDRSDVECCEEYNPWGRDPMPEVYGKVFPKSDFYLTDEELAMVKMVKERFTNIVVVLNIGGMMDLSWIKEDCQISAALLGWQGGMEGGVALAELLVGKDTPSGKLPDTFAAKLEDYPSTEGFHESVEYVDYTEDIYVGYRYFETIPKAEEKVVYPFGYGLSYTNFALDITAIYEDNERIRAEIQVKNIGDAAGKEVVQLYYEAPQGILKKPLRQLVAFAKTRKLFPGEIQEIRLSFSKEDMASYDDLGKIAKSAYVLEKGIYKFYIGDSVRNVKETKWKIELLENVIIKQLSAHMVPNHLKQRMLSDGSFEELPLGETPDMNACIFEKMISGTDEAVTPAVRACARGTVVRSDGKKQLLEVAQGKITLEKFMEQLSDDDLIHLLGGQPNMGVTTSYGYGNLPEYGIPSIMTIDGPAGAHIHMNGECTIYTTAFPCATLLASTWNIDLIWQIGKAAAEEVKENNMAVWLAPAVNIHRNPLCGRNFEYYSEDPLLAGKIGAAMVNGIQSQHIAASVKHFACNNKETNRKHSDSRISERALREIYLKVFEIIVKEAQPWIIMSSYNAINGCRASESRELLEDILRGEWAFQGMVTTDWWTRGEHYKEILAGNDVKMGTGFPERVKKAMEMGALGRTEIEHCARKVLELILKID